MISHRTRTVAVTSSSGHRAPCPGWRRVATWLVAFAALGLAAPAFADEEDPTPRVGWIELAGELREGPVPFAWVDEADADPSLREIVEQLDHIAVSDEHLGAVLHLDRPRLDLTQVSALAEAVERVRGADKPVFTFAEEYDLSGYLLAVSADEILLQHHGRVHLAGLSLEEFYVAGLLERIGMQADLMQKGDYKGAGEAFTRTGPSEPWSENIDAMLDDIYDQVLERIAAGRGIERDDVERLIADSWAMSDADYVQRGVVDRLTERDLGDITEPVFGERFTWDEELGRIDAAARAERARQMQNPLALLRVLFDEPEAPTQAPSIAMIHAAGPVTSGDSRRDGGPLATRTVGSRTMLEQLARVRRDPMIQGAVVRLNSPGGSAIASEVIWQAIRDVREEKPVFVSIGPLAASGGYYLAAAADQIHLSPYSIVGSIGVVGGKLVLGGTYDKLEINVHRRSRGPLADIFNTVEPFTDAQRGALEQRLERIYDQFTDRVTTGRGARLEAIDPVAHGRVFTGRQAVDNGLADALGGVNDTVHALAEHLQLEPEEYELVHLPPPMNLGEFIASILGVHGGAEPGVGPERMGLGAEATAAFELARHALGDDAWRGAVDALTGLMLLRDEPVLTLMPQVIVIR